MKINEGLFGTSHITLKDFFGIENFHCSSKTQFCIFDGDKEESDATLVVYGYEIVEGEEEVQPYLNQIIEYIDFDPLSKRVNICLIPKTGSLHESEKRFPGLNKYMKKDVENIFNHNPDMDMDYFLHSVIGEGDDGYDPECAAIMWEYYEYLQEQE